MDIVDFQEMGLIDGSTEFILNQNIGDTPQIVYTHDGSININPDFSAYGNNITFVTIPNIVHIIHDGNSQNVGYLINNNQIPFVSRPVVVNQDTVVEVDEPFPEENPIEQLEKQLSHFVDPLATTDSDANEKTGNNPTVKQPSPPVNEKSEKNVISSSSQKQNSDPSESEGSLFCGQCNLNFPSWKLYNKHKWKHINDKPFKCSKCDETFNYELNLKLHVATHNIDNPFCPVCKKKFGRIAGLKAHMMLHEQEESVFCNECGEEFNSHVHLEKHMTEHTERTVQKFKSSRIKKPFACNQCPQKFPTDAACKEHIIKKHKVKETRKLQKVKRRRRNNCCDFCLKCFEKPSQLLRHKRIHTGERPYECQLCSRAFSQKGSLQIHMLKHTRERPYICEYCKATFSQKGNLQAHIKRLHMAADGDERNYKCHLCSCIFRKLGSLNAHFTKAHSFFSVEFAHPSDNNKRAKSNGNTQKADCSSDSSNKENENAQKDKERPRLVMVTNILEDGTAYQRKVKVLSCSYCSKEFKNPRDLVRHVRTHTQEKPFKCKTCCKSFSMQSTLNVHIRTHTGVKSFYCPACNKCYSTSRSLRLHTKKHISCGDEKETEPHEFILRIEEKDRTETNFDNFDHHVDLSSLNGNIILTENGNIVDMSSDIEEEEEKVVDNWFKCLECNTQFKKLIHLRTHMQMHRVRVRYSCEHCPCTFNSKNTLKTHLKRHLQDQKASIALKKPLTEASLKQRKEIAKAGFPWACPVCGWVYKSSLACKKHILSRHPKLKLKPMKLVDKATENSEEQSKNTYPQGDSTLYPPGSSGDLSSQNQTLQSNPVYLIANAQGDLSLTTVTTEAPQHESQIGGIPMYEQSNISTNESASTNSLDPCIFTLQPGVTVNTPIIGTDVSNMVPQNQVIVPQNQVIIPQNQVVMPPNQVIIPQDQVMLPQNQVIIPENQVIIPQNQVIIPENQVIIPQNQVIIPQHQVVMPQNQMVMAQNQVVVPQNQVMMPENQVMMPQNQVVVPQNQVMMPQNQMMMPQSQVMMQQNQVMMPQNQVMMPQSQVILPPNQVIVPQDEVLNRCDLCNLVFTNMAEFSMHKAMHEQQPYTIVTSAIEDPNKTHYFVGRVINCSICNMEFHTEEEFQNHNEKYHLPSKGLPEKKKVRPNWRPPARRLTEEETKALSSIEPCGATISEKVLLQSLQEKERYEHPIKEEPKQQEVHKHKCKYCTKSFRKPSDLVRHLRTHTGERPYKCSFCNKRFSIKSTAACHMKTHTKGRSFECYVCSKHFSTTGSLKIHMRLHTGLKPFSCTLCDATFRTSGHQKAHLLKHMKDSMGTEGFRQMQIDKNNTDLMESEDEMLEDSSSVIGAEGSQYLVSLRGTDNPVEENGDEEYLSSLRVAEEEEPKDNQSIAQSQYLDCNDKGGGNLFSSKGEASGDNGFHLQDPIIVTITAEEDSEVSRRFNEEESKSVCLEKKADDLGLDSLDDDLDHDFSCPECTESFSLEEELRAHKCVKNASLDLLDHDLFLFPHV